MRPPLFFLDRGDFPHGGTLNGSSGGFFVGEALLDLGYRTRISLELSGKVDLLGQGYNGNIQQGYHKVYPHLNPSERNNIWGIYMVNRH